MKVLGIAALLLSTSISAMAGWNEINMPDVEHYKVYVGDKKVRVGDSVLFWSKEAYVPEVVQDADLDYGSKLVRYLADCNTGMFSKVFESTHKSFNGKGKLIQANNDNSKPALSDIDSIHRLLISAACNDEPEPQVTLADLKKSDDGVIALGQCFASRASYGEFIASMGITEDSADSGVI